MHLGKRQEANSSRGKERREVLPLGTEAELAVGGEGEEKKLVWSWEQPERCPGWWTLGPPSGEASALRAGHCQAEADWAITGRMGPAGENFEVSQSLTE